MANAIISANTPKLNIVNGHPVVSSLEIAEHFGKRHKDILRKIEMLPMDSEFTGRNFALSEYLDPSGRRVPLYNLTRDGFTLLAMGFTGKKAMEWKIRFIEAFNAMEHRLMENNQLALPIFPPYEPTLFEALLLHKVGGLLALMKGNMKRFADQNRIPDTTRAQLVDVFEGRQPMTIGVFAAVVHLIGITDIDGLIRHAITEAQSLALMSPSGFTVDAIMKDARKSIGKC